MNKRMIIMLTIAAVLFGGIFGYKAFVDRIITQVFDEMGPETVTITTTRVATDRWTPVAEAVGTVRAVQGSELAVEIGGLVSAIHFDNGQVVESGQRLISLEQAVDRAELRQLEAAARLAATEVARLEPLARRESVSRAELDRARTELEQAEAAVAVQQARIDQKTLRAPFDGILGIRAVNVGQYLSPGEPVVSLQALDPVHIDFTLPQRRLSALDNGRPISARVDAFPETRFEGEITAIEPRLRESSRSVLAQATLDNPDGLLRPGLFARVELEIGQAEDVVVVPQTAIRHATYGNSVFVVEEHEQGQRVIQRFVRTGATRGDLIAIDDGLEAGEEVATSGLLKLQNESPVEIDEDEAVRPGEDRDPRPANG